MPHIWVSAEIQIRPVKKTFDMGPIKRLTVFVSVFNSNLARDTSLNHVRNPDLQNKELTIYEIT